MVTEKVPRVNLTLEWHPTPRALILLLLSLATGLPALYEGVNRNWFRIHNGTEAFTVASGPFGVVDRDHVLGPGDPLVEVRPGDNFYWLPAKLAEFDWKKSSYVNTPALSYADMRDLAALPAAGVQVSARQGSRPGELAVEMRNGGKTVAFFNHLRAVKKGTDEEVVPVFWSDNFVSLLPGDKRDLTVSGLGDASVEIKADGWNVEPQTVVIATR